MSNGQLPAEYQSIIDFMQWDPVTNQIKFIPSTDVKIQFENEFLKIVPDLNLEPSTPQGQIITLLTNMVLTVIDNYQTITNTLFFGGSGVTLDHFAYNNYRLTRRQEEKGSVSIKINGSPGTIIESTEQNRFKVSDGDLIYELNNNIIIGDDGEITADFICTKFTTKVSKANTVTQITTPRINVERVTNPLASSSGVPAEDDHSLYLRCITYGSVYNNSSFRSMVANMNQTEGVIKVNAYENIASTALQYKGIQIPPHGVAFVILGGTSKSIGETFLKTKPPGTAMAGDENAEVIHQGHKIKYKFYRPTEVPLKIEVEVQTTTNMAANYDSIIKDKLIEFVNTLGIGTVITLPEVTCSISSLGFLLKEVKFSKKSASLGYTPIELQFKEMATLDKEDITVKKS